MTFFPICGIILVGGEIILWYEFETNPYRSANMNMNQRLIYEYEPDIFEIDNYSEQDFLNDVYCDEVEATWGKN